MFSTFILFQTDRTLVGSSIRLHVSTMIMAMVEHDCKDRIEYNTMWYVGSRTFKVLQSLSGLGRRQEQ